VNRRIFLVTASPHEVTQTEQDRNGDETECSRHHGSNLQVIHLRPPVGHTRPFISASTMHFSGEFGGVFLVAGKLRPAGQ
jgi:hypothetical protein